MADDIKVLKVDEETRFTDLGKPDTQMRVMFKVGDHGPFFLRFPTEGFSAYAVKQRLETFARDLHDLSS